MGYKYRELDSSIGREESKPPFFITVLSRENAYMKDVSRPAIDVILSPRIYEMHPRV
jgi:hypothetical protein